MTNIVSLFTLLFLFTLTSAKADSSESFSLFPDYTMQPSVLIDIAPRYPYTLIAELTTGKLFVYKRETSGEFTRVSTMEASIGKEGYGKVIEGDNKTPVGVYRITSFLSPEQLDDFYGNAAYPVNYPNAWDKRQKRTGFGIWLHAEPVGLTEKTRPMLDSNGCIVLSNNDIDIINQYIDVGYTYIVMTPKLEYVKVDQISKLRQLLRKRIDDWQLAWEARQDDPYLAFYSKDFSNLEKDWQEWVTYKKRVNGSKSFIDVGISDIGIYEYPGEDNMVWIEYFQTYNSNNYQSAGWKRQIWTLESDNVWRIIYEGGG